jgi:hypothetical protein
MHLRSAIAIVFCALPLAGCAVFEALGGMPYAGSSFNVPRGTTSPAVLDCAVASVTALNQQSDQWQTDVTHRDDARGVLETGRYAESNVAGLRVRVQYDPGGQQVRMGLKGAGAYYVDLGVKAGMAALESKMKACTKA